MTMKVTMAHSNEVFNNLSTLPYGLVEGFMIGVGTKKTPRDKNNGNGTKQAAGCRDKKNANGTKKHKRDKKKDIWDKK